MLGHRWGGRLPAVYAEDATGTSVPHENQQVRFCVEGAGLVLGVGNGDPNCHEADKSDRRSMFHGCCQAVVEASELSSEEPAALVVYAELEGGLQSERVVVPVLNQGHIPAPEPVEDRFNQYWQSWTG